MRKEDDWRAEVRKGLDYALEERLAPHYERHLVDECGYRTPDEIAAAVADGWRRAPPPGDATFAAQSEKPLWLDMGAGTGLVGKAFDRLGLAVELVALDLSPAMLGLIDCPRYVRRTCADAAGPLPFTDASFDGVLAAGLLEHVLDPEPLFRNAARVLKRGGGFAFTFPPNDHGRTELLGTDEGLVSHDPATLRASLLAAGLSVTRELDYPAYGIGSRGWVTHHLVLGIEAARTSK